MAAEHSDDDARSANLVAAMADPSFYPHGPDSIEPHETQISWVFVAGDLVYKLKKPVVLPFLDYGDREKRRRMCEEEVRLNRRLTSGVYLGVRSLVESAAGLALGPADREDALDWAVEMRRLPEDRTLISLLKRGKLEPEQVRRVAVRLAGFHGNAEPAPEERTGPERVKRLMDEEFLELFGLPASLVDRRGVLAMERFADAFVAAREGELRGRAAKGRIRDGHGDLRLEHVVLGDEVQVFDCVEFDPALRQLDVAADLAYLVMELVAQGADELVHELVEGYRRAGGDPGDDALLAFYAAYRAVVRAKLAYLGGAELSEEDPNRGEAAREGSELLGLAARFRWRARLPLLLVVCGTAASGKSVLAQALADASGVTVLGSDRTRKRLAGVAPTEQAGAEHYGDAFNRRTYRELGRLAAAELERAGGAIVDATFRRMADREAFAEGLGACAAGRLFVECRAPAGVLAERARRRQRKPGATSDATVEVVEAQLREFEQLDEVEASRHVVVRTDRDVAAVVDEVEAQLDLRLLD